MGPGARRTILAGSIVVAVAAGALAALLLGPRSRPAAPPVLALEKLAHLVSVKVNVADVVEFTESRTLDIPWSSWQLKYAGTRVLLIVKGDCLVGTNLAAGKYRRIDTAARTVTLVLPAPQVLQARVNHAPAEHGGSRLYSVSNEGIEALIPGNANRLKAIDAAMQIAQRKVEEAGRSPDVMRAATQNAEAVLRAAFGALGWSTRIEWEAAEGM